MSTPNDGFTPEGVHTPEAELAEPSSPGGVPTTSDPDLHRGGCEAGRAIK